MSIRRLLALDRLPVPPDVFDVDRQAIRHGRFGRPGEGLELERYDRQELPAELFAEGPLGGPLNDEKPFREALETLLGRLDEPPESASLVLPDRWLRSTFTEVEELPRRAAAREEALRFKLRRQVPFRVEELRLVGVEVAPLPGQNGTRRVMLGFAIRQLLDQLEHLFAGQGVRLGHVSSRSLSVLPLADDRLRPLDLAALAYVGPEGYSLVFTRAGEPALHRFKPINGQRYDDAWERLVARDLRLTKTYLDEQLPGERLRRVLLACGGERQERWTERLAEAFSVPIHPLKEDFPDLGADSAAPDFEELAPLMGAARRELR